MAKPIALHKPKQQILVVDSEPYNIAILEEYLADQVYRLQTAISGQEAWDLLAQAPDRFSAVLLDRVLGDWDGIDILKRMKENPIMKTIPVIFQTTKSSKADVLEGIAAGASYYLTKPYTRQKLVRIIEIALRENAHYSALRAELAKGLYGMQLMHRGEFTLQTLKQADNLSMILARACPAPEKVLVGLSELLINAIEHGNLEIGYTEKSALLESGQWEQEVNRRITDPAYRDRIVRVSFEKTADSIVLIIEDSGHGFEWKDYLEFNPDRAFDMHGRGIVTASQFSFEHIKYYPPGNKVKVTIACL